MFKILQSCLYKKSLIETGEETKWCLCQRSKKSCIIFKSDSDAPYTERQYVEFDRTKELNKQSISTKARRCHLSRDHSWWLCHTVKSYRCLLENMTFSTLSRLKVTKMKQINKSNVVDFSAIKTLLKLEKVTTIVTACKFNRSVCYLLSVSSKF